MARSCTAKGSLIRPKPSKPPGRLSSCFGTKAVLAVESGEASPSLISPLEPPSILGSHDGISRDHCAAGGPHWRPSPWRHLDHRGAPLAQEHRAAPVDHLFRPGTHEVAALDEKRLRATRRAPLVGGIQRTQPREASRGFGSARTCRTRRSRSRCRSACTRSAGGASDPHACTRPRGLDRDGDAPVLRLNRFFWGSLCQRCEGLASEREAPHKGRAKAVLSGPTFI